MMSSAMQTPASSGVRRPPSFRRHSIGANESPRRTQSLTSPDGRPSRRTSRRYSNEGSLPSNRHSQADNNNNNSSSSSSSGILALFVGRPSRDPNAGHVGELKSKQIKKIQKKSVKKQAQMTDIVQQGGQAVPKARADAASSLSPNKRKKRNLSVASLPSSFSPGTAASLLQQTTAIFSWKKSTDVKPTKLRDRSRPKSSRHSSRNRSGRSKNGNRHSKKNNDSSLPSANRHNNNNRHAPHSNGSTSATASRRPTANQSVPNNPHTKTFADTLMSPIDESHPSTFPSFAAQKATSTHLSASAGVRTGTGSDNILPTDSDPPNNKPQSVQSLNANHTSNTLDASTQSSHIHPRNPPLQLDPHGENTSMPPLCDVDDDESNDSYDSDSEYPNDSDGNSVREHDDEEEAAWSNEEYEQASSSSASSSDPSPLTTPVSPTAKPITSSYVASDPQQSPLHRTVPTRSSVTHPPPTTDVIKPILVRNTSHGPVSTQRIISSSIRSKPPNKPSSFTHLRRQRNTRGSGDNSNNKNNRRPRNDNGNPQPQVPRQRHNSALIPTAATLVSRSALRSSGIVVADGAVVGPEHTLLASLRRTASLEDIQQQMMSDPQLVGTPGAAGMDQRSRSTSYLDGTLSPRAEAKARVKLEVERIQAEIESMIHGNDGMFSVSSFDDPKQLETMSTSKPIAPIFEEPSTRQRRPVANMGLDVGDELDTFHQRFSNERMKQVSGDGMALRRSETTEVRSGHDSSTASSIVQSITNHSDANTEMLTGLGSAGIFSAPGRMREYKPALADIGDGDEHASDDGTDGSSQSDRSNTDDDGDDESEYEEETTSEEGSVSESASNEDEEGACIERTTELPVVSTSPTQVEAISSTAKSTKVASEVGLLFEKSDSQKGRRAESPNSIAGPQTEQRSVPLSPIALSSAGLTSVSVHQDEDMDDSERQCSPSKDYVIHLQTEEPGKGNIPRIKRIFELKNRVPSDGETLEKSSRHLQHFVRAEDTPASTEESCNSGDSILEGSSHMSGSSARSKTLSTVEEGSTETSTSHAVLQREMVSQPMMIAGKRKDATAAYKNGSHGRTERPQFQPQPNQRSENQPVSSQSPAAAVGMDVTQSTNLLSLPSHTGAAKAHLNMVNSEDSSGGSSRRSAGDRKFNISQSNQRRESARSEPSKPPIDRVEIKHSLVNADLTSTSERTESNSTSQDRRRPDYDLPLNDGSNAALSISANRPRKAREGNVNELQGAVPNISERLSNGLTANIARCTPSVTDTGQTNKAGVSNDECSLSGRQPKCGPLKRSHAPRTMIEEAKRELQCRYQHESSPTSDLSIRSMDRKVSMASARGKRANELKKRVQRRRDTLKSMFKTTTSKSMEYEIEILELKRKLALSQSLVENLEIENSFLQREVELMRKSADVKLLQAVHKREAEMEERLKAMQIERDESVQESHLLRKMVAENCPACRHRLQQTKFRIMDKPVQDTILQRRALRQNMDEDETGSHSAVILDRDCRLDAPVIPASNNTQRCGSIFSDGIVDEIGSMSGRSFLVDGLLPDTPNGPGRKKSDIPSVVEGNCSCGSLPRDSTHDSAVLSSSTTNDLGNDWDERESACVDNECASTTAGVAM